MRKSSLDTVVSSNLLSFGIWLFYLQCDKYGVEGHKFSNIVNICQWTKNNLRELNQLRIRMLCCAELKIFYLWPVCYLQITINLQ